MVYGKFFPMKDYLKSSDFKFLSSKLNCEFIDSTKINSEEIIRKIRSLELDIGISVNYVNVISKKVIDSFKFGILNAHGGDLPKLCY